MSVSTKRHCESSLTAGSSPAIGGGVAVGCYSFDSSGNVLGVFDGNGNPLATSDLGSRYLFQGREYSWATHAAVGAVGNAATVPGPGPMNIYNYIDAGTQVTMLANLLTLNKEQEDTLMAIAEASSPSEKRACRAGTNEWKRLEI